MVLPVPWKDSPAGKWCKHCAIGVGCKLWDNGIPDDCKSFVCAYNQVDNISPDLRPDRCKIIFEKVDNTMLLGTMHPHYNEAYKEKIIQNEIGIFLKRGFSVVISSFTIKKPIIFAVHGRKASDVWSSLRTQSKERYDSASVHN
jgi:hypothetical protein